MANGPRTVTLNEVAERANSDPDFFEAVVAHFTEPNRGLAPFEMRLSEADEIRLKAGLTAIKYIDIDFQQFGGWGRWPRFLY
ncbi:MAG TPA: hypothetical protein VHJ77_09490 [Vicinamibacterales bacterium]|jgi:hypothetical protein|nr:hypothetical protein [Vicinamibacterales bacterium]